MGRGQLSASELITGTAQVLLAAIVIPAALRAVRHRTRGAIDIALFFGFLDLLLLRSALGLADVPVIGQISGVLAYALPYLMLRLLGDFTRVPPVVMRATEAAFAVLAVSAFVYPGPGTATPAAVTLVRVLYFVAVFAYTGRGFVRLARTSTGVTRRRMQAVSIGNALFALVIAAAGLIAVVPGLAITSPIVIGPGILATAIAWFLGFATPAPVRRFWQEPELRAFLTRAPALARLGSTLEVVRELSRGAAASSGARANIGVWIPEDEVIRFWDEEGQWYDVRPGQHLSGRAFAEQRPILSVDPVRDNPALADHYRKERMGIVLVTPITAEQRRIGVLMLTAERPPVFALSDVELAQLLADQAAAVLESHRLSQEAAQVRAREEAARLKEDFISAAAHDLRTPLTALYGRAQLLQRRLKEGLPPDAATGERILADVRRLTALTDALLDASRIGEGRLEIRRETIDLGRVIRELHAGRADWARVRLDVEDGLVGELDRARVEQVVDNLVENALKYSEPGTDVVVTARRESEAAHLSVRDHGIGIPVGEIDAIFDRFRRGSNVAERHFGGIGLGLFICRGIVEEHGGRISAESEPGEGTTMHVRLPLSTVPETVEPPMKLEGAAS
jgi:signal transduction histidine kinase